MLNLLKWLGKTIAEKVVGDVLDWKTIARLVLVWLGTSAAGALTILHGSYVVKGWFLALIAAYALVVTVIAAILVRWAIVMLQGFRETRVQVPQLGLEWRLREDPATWADGPLPSELGQRGVLAGPYHFGGSRPCSAEVGFALEDPSLPRFRAICPRCQPDQAGERLAQLPYGVVEGARREALEEIQRRYRTGERWSGGVIQLDAARAGGGFLASPRGT